MENEKKYETISLDLSKFKIDSKYISEFISKNTVETLVNIVTEAAYKDNELKGLQEIVKKIGEENLKLKSRIKNCKKYLQIQDSHEFNAQVPIAILDGNKEVVKDEYMMFKRAIDNLGTEYTEESKFLEKLVMESE